MLRARVWLAAASVLLSFVGSAALLAPVPAADPNVVEDFESGATGVFSAGPSTTLQIVGANGVVPAITGGLSGSATGDQVGGIADLVVFFSFIVDPGVYNVSVDVQAISDVQPTVSAEASFDSNGVFVSHAFQPAEFVQVAADEWASPVFTLTAPNVDASGGAISGTVTLDGAFRWLFDNLRAEPVSTSPETVLDQIESTVGEALASGQMDSQTAAQLTDDIRKIRHHLSTDQRMQAIDRAIGMYGPRVDNALDKARLTPEVGESIYELGESLLSSLEAPSPAGYAQLRLAVNEHAFAAEIEPEFAFTVRLALHEVRRSVARSQPEKATEELTRLAVALSRHIDERITQAAYRHLSDSIGEVRFEISKDSAFTSCCVNVRDIDMEVTLNDWLVNFKNPAASTGSIRGEAEWVDEAWGRFQIPPDITITASFVLKFQLRGLHGLKGNHHDASFSIGMVGFHHDHHTPGVHSMPRPTHVQEASAQAFAESVIEELKRLDEEGIGPVDISTLDFEDPNEVVAVIFGVSITGTCRTGGKITDAFVTEPTDPDAQPLRVEPPAVLNDSRFVPHARPACAPAPPPEEF